MTSIATAEFINTYWDEKPYLEKPDHTKFTRVSAKYSYTGELIGVGAVEYLMFYRPDGTGVFTGLEDVVGQLAGRAGRFVFAHRGTFDPSQVHLTVTVVSGSGAGALAGLTGDATQTLIGHGPYPLTLRYAFTLPEPQLPRG